MSSYSIWGWICCVWRLPRRAITSPRRLRASLRTNSPRGPKPDATREKVAKTNVLLATLDGKDGITFQDVTPKLLEPDGSISKETMGDFLHPTQKGYEIIAEAIEPTLKKLLGE